MSAVEMTAPGGFKVTVPDEMVEHFEGQGYTVGGDAEAVADVPVEPQAAEPEPEQEPAKPARKR